MPSLQRPGSQRHLEEKLLPVTLILHVFFFLAFHLVPGGMADLVWSLWIF